MRRNGAAGDIPAREQAARDCGGGGYGDGGCAGEAGEAPESQARPCPAKECLGKRYFCAVELTLQVIGGKWKPIILWHLKEGGLRFGELRRRIPNVTQKMFTQQLRELESDGLLLRRVHAQVPPKVEYSLTELGAGVLPLIEGLSAWGRKLEALAGVREAAD